MSRRRRANTQSREPELESRAGATSSGKQHSPPCKSYSPPVFSTTFASPSAPSVVLLGESGGGSKLTPLRWLPKLSLLPSLLASLNIPGSGEMPSLLNSATLVRRAAREPAGDMLKVAKGSVSRGVLGVCVVGVEGTVAAKSQEVIES